MIKVKHFSQAKQNKTTIILLVFLIAMLASISPMYTFCSNSDFSNISDSINNSVIEELQEIDFSGFNEVILEFEKNNTNIFSIDNIKNKVYSIITGENAVNYESFFASIFSIFLEMIIKYLPMLSLIIAIGVINNLLNGVKSKFNEKSTSNLVHLVCFMTVVILMIGLFNSISNTVQKSLNLMVSQMNIMFPILLTLMTGLGAHISVGVFQPIVAILTTYTADIFNYFILPLFMVSFVFSIITNLSDNIKLDKFESFVSSLFKWSVGLIFTIFFAVFTIQGISAGSFDSLSIRTTKYTMKSYIPIMGGYLSDGMDIILSSTLLIKNSLGLVGVLMIISVILSPILEIVVFSLLLKLVSAILQPIGNTKISNFLTSSSKTVTMLSTCLIAVGFMYLISIGLIMTTSNLVV